MNKIEYQSYLKSSHWLEFKAKFRKSKLCKHKCYICGSRNNIHLHHKTYKNLGKERLMDIIELCQTCHFRLHNLYKLNESQNTNLWNISRKLRKKYLKHGKI